MPAILPWLMLASQATGYLAAEILFNPICLPISKLLVVALHSWLVVGQSGHQGSQSQIWLVGCPFLGSRILAGSHPAGRD